jgi:transposase
VVVARAQIAKIQWLKRNGASIRLIRKEVGVSPNTIYGVLN